jgi:hypothetical protein
MKKDAIPGDVADAACARVRVRVLLGLKHQCWTWGRRRCGPLRVSGAITCAALGALLAIVALFVCEFSPRSTLPSKIIDHTREAHSNHLLPYSVYDRSPDNDFSNNPVDAEHGGCS